MPKQDALTLIQNLHRLYDLLDQRPGLQVQEMSEVLQIPVSTLYRYMTTYMPVLWGEGCIKKSGKGHALSGKAERRIRLSPQDQLSLLIARKLFKQIQLPHGDAFERIFTKLSDTGSEQFQLLQAQVERTIAFSEPVLCRPPRDAGLFTQLFDHCTEQPRRLLHIVYDSETSPAQKTRQIIPLALLFHHAWYLVGKDDSKTPPIRVYAVDRIRSAKPDPSRRAHPDLNAFDVQDFIGQAWRLIRGESPQTVRVVLRMPKHLALAHKHRSQDDQGPIAGEGSDHRVVFQVGAPEEMVPFILSHSPRVEVLEPAALREKVVQRLRKTLETYTTRAFDRCDPP